MGILLIHDQKDQGNVAVSEGKVAGEHTPARHYEHEGKFLHIDGPAHVVEHDAAEIRRMSGYRLATASEQNEYATLKRSEQHITEAPTDLHQSTHEKARKEKK